MGLTEDTRRALTRHDDEVTAVVQELRGLIETVDGCRRRLAADGPIGRTTDRALDQARSRLDAAHRRLREALAAAQSCTRPARDYVDRAFPL